MFPTITFGGGTGAAVGSLADYFGVPPSVNNLEVSALPFRGYALIFNEWYRDQDLVNKLTIDETSGPDTTTSTALQYAAWEKDYFTAARPWEQKGPAITIPLGDTAPLSLTNQPPSANSGSLLRRTNNSSLNADAGDIKSTAAGVLQSQPSNPLLVDVTPHTVADISGASAVTVNLLREAFALQRFEEARARFGSRYTEYLRYLGVVSPDARLQRPEFLGGGRYPVQFSEVLQTAEGENPVGELRGHGIGVARSNRYRRYFPEHGYVFTIVTVKPKTIYSNGLFRHWNRRTKEDFFQKELQHIGQQELLNKEVRAAHANPNGVFGYTDRYAEYRGAESSIAGEFRTTLDFWHFARQFTADPALNETFVKCVPTEEPFAVPSANTLYVMAKHHVQARRIVSGNSSSFIY